MLVTIGLIAHGVGGGVMRGTTILLLFYQKKLRGP